MKKSKKCKVTGKKTGCRCCKSSDDSLAQNQNIVFLAKALQAQYQRGADDAQTDNIKAMDKSSFGDWLTEAIALAKIVCSVINEIPTTLVDCKGIK